MSAISIVIAILIVLLLLNAFAAWYIIRLVKGAGSKAADRGFEFLQKEIQNLRTSFDSKLGNSTKEIHDTVRSQLSESSRLIKEITQEVTSVKEIGRQTQTFAEQLQGLQDILKNPKQRGVLGEYYLETVLKNVLPPNMYQVQYGFNNGEIVDAVVFVNDKIVPIDSKFSLENYNRLVHARDEDKAALERTFVNDLKLRIQETAKYIRPEEDTMDFAFMFIPSEGIYYDLLTNQVGASDDENLIQRAASKYKVIIVSPTSFLAYLQTVLQGLKALQIEKQAEEIQKRVGELGRHIGKYDEYYKKLGNTLATTVNHYNAGYKELSKIDKDVTRIAGEGADIEPLELDKPNKDD